MEIKGAALLYTLSGLMITFTGFSVLSFGVRQAAGARLSLLDRFIAKEHTVLHFCIDSRGALLPPLFALYDSQGDGLWRSCGVLFAIPMLSLQVRYPRRRRKAVGDGSPPAIFAVFVVLGSAATLAMLGYVLVGFPYSAAAHIIGLILDFFTVVFGFVAALDIIMRQPMEISERPARR